MGISYAYETAFVLREEVQYSDWINRIVASEKFALGELCFIFCDDVHLLEYNKRYLSHDTLTDIITFDYTEGKRLSGDIFISVERVYENADELSIDRSVELIRVMAHGLLHLMGYNDKTDRESKEMRNKEDEKIKLFHVER